MVVKAALLLSARSKSLSAVQLDVPALKVKPTLKACQKEAVPWSYFNDAPSETSQKHDAALAEGLRNIQDNCPVLVGFRMSQFYFPQQ